MPAFVAIDEPRAAELLATVVELEVLARFDSGCAEQSADQSIAAARELGLSELEQRAQLFRADFQRRRGNVAEAGQFAREGIRVNALSPGPVNTPLLQELFAKDPERAARRLVHIPVGRFVEPDEIAAAVAFLASDDSSFITAAEFLVDGGLSGAYVTPL